MILRDYQQRVLDDLWDWFAAHPDGDPYVSACVGAGKSLMIAEWCKRCILEYPGTRVLMAVHVKELVEQNLEKLLRVWPDAPAGVHSASVGRKDLGHDILYATIGSVYKKAHLLGRVDMLMIDECHLVSPQAATMYRRLIDELRVYNPAMRVIGWTGTPFRGDGLWLQHHGLFTHMATSVGMTELLEKKYLSPLVVAPVETVISTDGVKIVNGDYNQKQLGEAATRGTLVEDAVGEVCRLAADRRRWLLFGATVEHAEKILAALRARGVAAELVTGDTPKAERERIIAGFRAGAFRALVNVAVLTTGFDAPGVDCIALMRPTRSPVMYVQIAGRGMRVADGKENCLWLDFTSTTLDLGPVNEIRGRNPQPPGNAPIRYCDECGAENHASARSCKECGAPFPPPAEPVRDAHATKASLAAVISDNGLMWHSITRVTYSRHPAREPHKPDTLRVDYYSGFKRTASEWICLEHQEGSYPWRKARDWWSERTTTGQFPEDIDEALTMTDQLREPGRVATVMDGQYPRLISMLFPEGAPA